MVNFKLGNEMWKVNWSTWHERGTKKKYESVTGIEPLTSQTLGGCSIHRAPAWLIERPPGVWEVMGSIPVGDWGFFFVPRSCRVDQFTLRSTYLYSCNSQDLDDSAAVPDQLLKSSEEQDPATGTVSYTLQIMWKFVSYKNHTKSSLVI